MHISLLFLIIGVNSCKENTFVVDNNIKPGIYFSNDSIKYSFGVTKAEIKEYTIEVPVKVMGMKSNVDREFKIQITEPGIAVHGKHFSIPESLVIMADSLNGLVPIKIIRDELGDQEYRIAIKLVSNENFEPVNENFKDVVVYFNNIIDRPNWKNWRGEFSWPSDKLGQPKGTLGWNPVVYAKFIEFFRELENIEPARYNAIVAVHGEDLAVINESWPYDFDNTLTKFVLIPLYKYFMEENPQLGEVIPRPKGY